MEPRDLDAIPKEETTATHLKVTHQRRPGVEPEDLDLGGGCRGCAPPRDDLRFSNTTSILQKKTMWFIGAEVEQETSAPPPKKNPGPPLNQRRKLQPTHLQATQ